MWPTAYITQCNQLQKWKHTHKMAFPSVSGKKRELLVTESVSRHRLSWLMSQQRPFINLVIATGLLLRAAARPHQSRPEGNFTKMAVETLSLKTDLTLRSNFSQFQRKFNLKASSSRSHSIGIRAVSQMWLLQCHSRTAWTLCVLKLRWQN